MKKLLLLSVVLAVAGLCTTAAAQEVEKTIILMRSMDDPDIPPDYDRCNAVAPFEANMVLGASMWSSNTRANNGQVVKEKVRQVGTANACFLAGDLTSPPYQDEALFYIELTAGDLEITAEGECQVTTNVRGRLAHGPFHGFMGPVSPFSNPSRPYNESSPYKKNHFTENNLTTIPQWGTIKRRTIRM